MGRDEDTAGRTEKPQPRLRKVRMEPQTLLEVKSGQTEGLRHEGWEGKERDGMAPNITTSKLTRSYTSNHASIV
jgi:hypothetical protein